MKKVFFEVIDLNFGFNQDQVFFKNISLQLQAGTFYLLTGANGIGKSTFFRVLTGAVTPHEFLTGRVCLGDKVISLDSRADYRHLQELCMLVPQTFDHVVVRPLTVQENLQAAQLKKYPSLSLMPRVPESAMTAAYATLPLDTIVSHLSGGQRQVLSLCMMMQKNASVLLFDEPTAALDQKQALHIASVFSQQALMYDKVIIASCHDARLIATHNPAHILSVELDNAGYRFIRSSK